MTDILFPTNEKDQDALTIDLAVIHPNDKVLEFIWIFNFNSSSSIGYFCVVPIVQNNILDLSKITKNLFQMIFRHISSELRMWIQTLPGNALHKELRVYRFLFLHTTD